MDRLEDLQKNPEQTQQTSSSAEEGAVDNAAVQVEPFDFKGPINKLIQVIQWFVVVLEIALVLRFFFRLFGADATNLFVGFLYALTGVILTPFSNIFLDGKIHPSNVLEWSTLIGMLIIWLLYRAVRWLLRIVVSDPGEQPS
ncbi:MAG TPA: YggT family protein [Ktedonobacteraceae bacterium]|nr:YggT family protein [Ktedonobacteraceae bacterium]